MTGFDEIEFRKWYAGHATKLGLNIDPDKSEHHYDYRAAFLANAIPDETGHWPSKFKLLSHPNRYIEVDGCLFDTITNRYSRAN